MSVEGERSRAAIAFRPSRTSLAAMLGLLGLWVLFSGKLDAFHIAMGALSVLLVVWLQRGLPSLRGSDPKLVPWRVVLYGFWLFWQMLAAAVYVARIILFGPKERVEPQMLAFDSKQPSLLNRVILANSITLTPGTITVDLEEGRYIVHALTSATRDDVLTGAMAQRVANLCGVREIGSPALLPTPLQPEEDNVQ